MSKITITIADKDDGAVGITFDPPRSELIAHVKRVGADNISMVYHYAKACDAICKYISEQLDKTNPEESKDKKNIWLPAMENVAKIWSP